MKKKYYVSLGKSKDNTRTKTMYLFETFCGSVDITIEKYFMLLFCYGNSTRIIVKYPDMDDKLSKLYLFSVKELVLDILVNRGILKKDKYGYHFINSSPWLLSKPVY